MEFREAVGQIDTIRAQIARGETFRGYRSVTVGFSGVVGMAVAAVQSAWIPRPMDQVGDYLALWIVAAMVCAGIWGIEITWRCRRATSAVLRRTTVLAVEQFVPCLAGGGVLTWALATFAPESAWILPGLWSVVFSLGAFASCRLLPRPMALVGGYYLLAGAAALAIARGDAALSPWAMVGTFGVGQLLAAAILYLTLERSEENDATGE